MAEFYLQTHLFLNTEWKELMTKAKVIETECIGKCDSNKFCEENCKRPVNELSALAIEKQELYVKKGVEFCKSRCLGKFDLRMCTKKCVTDYSPLFNDFKSSLIDHYKSTRFYNT